MRLLQDTNKKQSTFSRSIKLILLKCLNIPKHKNDFSSPNQMWFCNKISMIWLVGNDIIKIFFMNVIWYRVLTKLWNATVLK